VSEIDYPEEFTPIAAGLKRLPYLAPSANFADRVISRVTRLGGSNAPAPVNAAQPRLEVVRGGAVGYVPDSALVKARRRRLMKVAVGVPVAAGVLIAVAVLFAQLDVIAVLLSASAVQLGIVIGVIGTGVGNLVLGDAAMATLQTATPQAALLYLEMVFGLIAGYSGIKVAGEIARRKAA
jgi:hypothetical protein